MRHCYVTRVFTRNGVGGNPLGVVTDVSGLSDRLMQRVATDLGFSETVFVDWRDGGVPRVRMFTPTAELPFAGHPMVGAAWVMNVLGPTHVPTLACPAGDVSVRLADDVVVIEAPPTDRPVRPARLEHPLDTWVEPVDVRIVAMPLDYLLVQVADPETVARAEPASRGHVMLWAWNGANVKARFFAPDLGVPEDPATGSAAVALATVLDAAGRSDGTIEITQGDEMGCPSTIILEWHGTTVSLGGSVSLDEIRELDV